MLRTFCSARMAAGPERDRGPQSRAASFALAAYQTRERLISWRRGAWRRRWLGVGTAWTLCLIGWTGALLLAGHEVASTEPYVDPEGNQATDAERTEIAAADAKGAVSPGAAGGGQVPDDPFLPLQASREKAASLHGDLTAALALHEARARHLAKVPRALDGGRQRNPIHEQAAIQLRQQEGLIAVLESRLAAEQARIAALEQALRGQSGTQVGSGEAGPDRAPHPRAWTVPDPQADRALANAGAEIAGGNGRPTLRHVPAPSRPIGPEPAPRA